VAPQTQRKPAHESPRAPRRAAILPPANDNRARRRWAVAGLIALLAVAAAYMFAKILSWA